MLNTHKLVDEDSAEMGMTGANGLEKGRTRATTITFRGIQRGRGPGKVGECLNHRGRHTTAGEEPGRTMTPGNIQVSIFRPIRKILQGGSSACLQTTPGS